MSPMQLPAPCQDLEQIFRAALASVDPQQLIESRLQLCGSRLTVASESNPLTIDLDHYDQLMVLGAGKATAAMARGLENLLGPRIGSGLIVVKYGHTAPLTRIETLEAGHPAPDAASLLGARRLAAMATRVRESASAVLKSAISGPSRSPLRETWITPMTVSSCRIGTLMILRMRIGFGGGAIPGSRRTFS